VRGRREMRLRSVERRAQGCQRRRIDATEVCDERVFCGRLGHIEIREGEDDAPGIPQDGASVRQPDPRDQPTDRFGAGGRVTWNGQVVDDGVVLRPECDPSRVGVAERRVVEILAEVSLQQVPVGVVDRLPTTERENELSSSVPSQMMPEGASTKGPSLNAISHVMWPPSTKHTGLNSAGGGGFSVLGSTGVRADAGAASATVRTRPPVTARMSRLNRRTVILTFTLGPPVSAADVALLPNSSYKFVVGSRRSIYHAHPPID
jgi:hypothetical protein